VCYTLYYALRCLVRSESSPLYQTPVTSSLSLVCGVISPLSTGVGRDSCALGGWRAFSNGKPEKLLLITAVYMRLGRGIMDKEWSYDVHDLKEKGWPEKLRMMMATGTAL
jgi:hypothetical protein